MTDLPRYDELHVVSDLHLGGARGFQIFKHGKRLANFIRWVGQQRPGGRVGLVLNGDVIDSLAEDIGGYIATSDAVSMVERIINDQAFSPVCEALQAFVGAPGRSLIVVIGNHDLELALPAVQHTLASRLAGDDSAARGRMTFATSGAGYACVVGTARVFCIHGNEVDSWNVVDYDALSLLARTLNAGLPPDSPSWQPNAGTKLVKDVMNEVKRTFAWIDLLKPETKAAVGVLAVLDPGQLSKIIRGIPIFWEKLRGTLKISGILSADESGITDGAVAQDMVLTELLGPALLSEVTKARSTSAPVDDMLRQAEEHFDKPRMYNTPSDTTLGWPQLVWDRLTGVEKPEALRRALKDWLRSDKTFDISDRDGTFEAVMAKVGPGVDVVVTGHTHLERAIALDSRRCYFNCGTWIRLLRFTETILDDPAAFREVYDVLMDGTLERIDEAGQRFAIDQTSAVCIRTEGGETVSELVHVEGENPVTRKLVTNPFRSR